MSTRRRAASMRADARPQLSRQMEMDAARARRRRAFGQQGRASLVKARIDGMASDRILSRRSSISALPRLPGRPALTADDGEVASSMPCAAASTSFGPSGWLEAASAASALPSSKAASRGPAQGPSRARSRPDRPLCAASVSPIAAWMSPSTRYASPAAHGASPVSRPRASVIWARASASVPFTPWTSARCSWQETRHLHPAGEAEALVTVRPLCGTGPVAEGSAGPQDVAIKDAAGDRIDPVRESHCRGMVLVRQPFPCPAEAEPVEAAIHQSQGGDPQVVMPPADLVGLGSELDGALRFALGGGCRRDAHPQHATCRRRLGTPDDQSPACASQPAASAASPRSR